MLRKLVTAALTLTVGVGLASCGSSGTTPGSTATSSATSSAATSSAPSPSTGGGGGAAAGGEIDLITVDQSNPFWKAEAATAVAEIKKLGYTSNVSQHLNDPTKQTQLIDAAIQKKVKAIILDPAGAKESVGAVQKATSAGIPVFLVNAEIAQQGIAKTQIVSNNAQGAVLGATEWAKQVKSGEYVELYGQPTDNNAKIRSDGYAQTLAQYPDLKKVDQQTANWDRAQGKTKMETMLKAHPNITGVIAGNDEMALGAVEAIKQAGKAGKIKVLGFDGSQDAVDAVTSGDLVATVLQPIVAATRLAVDQADAFLTTGETGASAEKQSLNCTLITKANAANFNAFVPVAK